MPEKPEVITVVKSLKPKLVNRKILSTKIYWDNIIEYPDVLEFSKNIKNQTINDITTRGKWLVFKLDNYYLLIHLRMEGKFFFRTNKDKKDKHEHVFFNLDDGTQLRFADVRKFGKMCLIKKEDITTIGPLKELGLEYYDNNLNGKYLKEKLSKKTIPIKTALLDQSIIAGIGNIYDDEILFMSRINPKTKSNNISLKQCNDIVKNTAIVLEKAIEKGGSTIKSYTSSEGVHGLFQEELLVHTKKICPNCKSPIEKIKINGRGTYFCPKCQK